MTEEIKKEITPLINFALNYAKEFLTDSEEFYPFGAYLNIDNALKSVASYDGDEFPLSQTVIDRLEKSLEHDFQTKRIKGYCVVFDALTSESSSSEKVNTIVIQLRHYAVPETYSYFLSLWP